jgi:hypothetical protein
MPVENPFYQCVSLSQTDNLISGSCVIRKDVVFQVGPDLHDPCIKTSLSFWFLCVGMHRVSCDAYDPWQAPWNQDRRHRYLRGAGLTPSLDSAARAVGCHSCLSSTTSRTGAKVEALLDRSSATAFSMWGMWCRSRTSKSFSSLRAWSR